MSADLAELNNSGVNATATLTDADGQVKITIAFDEASEDAVPRPAHIHSGTCPNPGAVKYPLNDVINGKSETTLGVSLDSLKQEASLAINVHKSAKEISSYIACGDVK